MNRRGFFSRMAGLLAFPLFSKRAPKSAVRGEKQDSGFCDPRWLDGILNLETGKIAYVGHDFFVPKEDSDA